MNVKYRMHILLLVVLALWAWPQVLPAAGGLPYATYSNVRLSDISPQGWPLTLLQRQRSGLTGSLDTLCFPFNKGGWIGATYMRQVKKGNIPNWIPYEQTGYYYDGVLRCGLLLHDSTLIHKAYAQLYGAMAQAQDGVILAQLSGVERSRWPHAVFFRGYMAAFEATGDTRILDALEQHYTRDTTTLLGRDVCNVEQMVWLYQHTGRRQYLDQALRTYQAHSANPNANLECRLQDLESDAKVEIHAVTYHEMLKLPILLYMATGEQRYLDAARKGFAKLDRWHMMADGVPSSEEGLSGQGGLAAHELCNIADYSWACTYMLKATGEVQWADRIERAVLNAGLGSITHDFETHQYYSSCNQVVCTGGSSQAFTYAASRMAYRTLHRPPCCTGNVNRFFPIYVGTQWLQGDRHMLVKALYGPGSYTHQVGKSKVVLSEESVFPFTDESLIRITEGNARFALRLRVPTWAVDARITLNGQAQTGVVAGQFYTLDRHWSTGDVLVLHFGKQGQFKVWDSNAMLVDYGPLVFSLPVAAKISRVPIASQGDSRSIYGYDMQPTSKWNYILGVDGTIHTLMTVKHHPITNPLWPWGQEVAPIQIRVPMHEDKTWKLFYRESDDEEGHTQLSAMTPPNPARGAMIIALRRSKVEGKWLVPYACTYLKMTLFPYWAETRIAPEVIAADAQ